VLEEAAASASAIGDHRLLAETTLVLLLVQMHGDEGAWGARALSEALHAITVFEQVGDNVGLAKAWRIVGSVHATALRYGEAAEAVERAIDAARRGGDGRQERRLAAVFTIAAVSGPTPIDEAIERCREIGERSGGDRRTEGLVLCGRSQLEAMRGNFTEARRLYARARAVLAEVGAGILAASTALDSSVVEMLAGDPAEAERELRRDYEVLEQMGERYLLSTVAGLLAQALVAQGRNEEAEAMCGRAEQMSAEDDVESQVLVRGVRAELHLLAGRTAEAAAAIGSAAELLRGADAPMVMADVLALSARVQVAGGDRPTAERDLQQAAALYRAKGNVVAERRTVELAAGLGLGSVTA
jgi:ATP/maltotriose-dependent transcriptional regulator MalT